METSKYSSLASCASCVGSVPQNALGDYTRQKINIIRTCNRVGALDMILRVWVGAARWACRAHLAARPWRHPPWPCRQCAARRAHPAAQSRAVAGLEPTAFSWEASTRKSRTQALEKQWKIKQKKRVKSCFFSIFFFKKKKEKRIILPHQTPL